MREILLSILLVCLSIAILAVLDKMYRRQYESRARRLQNIFYPIKGEGSEPCNGIEICGKEMLKVYEGWEISAIEHDNLPADKIDRLVITLIKIPSGESSAEGAR